MPIEPTTSLVVRIVIAQWKNGGFVASAIHRSMTFLESPISSCDGKRRYRVTSESHAQANSAWASSMANGLRTSRPVVKIGESIRFIVVSGMRIPLFPYVPNNGKVGGSCQQI